VTETIGLAKHRDGWLPIEDYAAIGDGRTVALVARDGQIDWWPVPDLDAPPLFGALLHPDGGGCVALCPEGEFEATRRYLPGSNVLETTFTTPNGTVRVTDALTIGMSGPLPWSELTRRVEGVSGAVSMRWRVAPGGLLGGSTPWVQPASDRTQAVLHSGDRMLGVCAWGLGEPTGEVHEVGAGVEIRAGDTGLLCLTSGDGGQLWLPDHESVRRRFDYTVAWWPQWCRQVHYDGPWDDAVRRSALALKLLLYEPTGAIAAAATTSLPEQVGGDANYDYRFMWVRDAAFTADALMSLGLGEETHAAVAWLVSVVRRTAPDLHVLYTLSGNIADDLEELPVPGYRDSRPVRRGNDASGQRQWGTFGDLFDTVWTYVRCGHVLDSDTGRMLARLADRCCDTWRLPDSGLWELPQREHYTVSKMGVWVALDRAVKLCEAGQLPSEHTHRWSAEARVVRDWVNDNCWSAAKRSYTFYAGTDDLDAAVLLAGQNGFDREERLASTADAIGRELREGPLVWRYSGQRHREGAFLACTFWLVTALRWSGRRDEAVALMDEAVGLGNDLGLLSEERSADGHLLGNIPQGLSHLALVNAATALNG
jgi:GH15 family glucan-1,4-alpha-glucosidase